MEIQVQNLKSHIVLVKNELWFLPGDFLLVLEQVVECSGVLDDEGQDGQEGQQEHVYHVEPLASLGDRVDLEKAGGHHGPGREGREDLLVGYTRLNEAGEMRTPAAVRAAKRAPT